MAFWKSLDCLSFTSSVISLLGKDKDGSCREQISFYAKAVDELITGLSKDGSLMLALQLPCLQSVVAARDELQVALQCLHSWNQQAGENRSSAASDKSTEEDNITKESVSSHSAVRNKVVSKVVYTLPPGVTSVGNAHWVWWAFLFIGLFF